MAPLGILALLGGAATLLALIRRPKRNRRVQAQAAVSMAAWFLLWFATASPFAQRSMGNLPDHMIGHVLVMFAVPMALIAGSTLRSWAWCLPVGFRRTVQRAYYRRRWRTPGWLASPLTAALVLNVVMVGAHLPRFFDASMAHRSLMDWVMEPAFLFSGLFFFHFLIPAWPRPLRARLRWQFGMVVVTMLEMLIMAMAMSIFTKSAWYVMESSAMTSMPGMSMATTASFSQQQLAAAILWICGDFWAVPCLILIVRRVVQREGSLLAALDRQSSRLSAGGA